MANLQIVEQLLKLPQYIRFEGITFSLKLWNCRSDEVWLAYEINDVKSTSPHYQLYNDYLTWENPFIKVDDLYGCGFLYLVEGIENDEQLLAAIERTLHFLKKNNFIDTSKND